MGWPIPEESGIVKSMILDNFYLSLKIFSAASAPPRGD
jgi:hypothetical protein